MKHYFEYYRNHEPGYQRKVRNLSNSLQPVGGPVFNNVCQNVAASVLTPEIY